MVPHWKNVLSGVSLANLTLLQVWTDVLSYDRADAYLMRLPPSPEQYGAIFAAMCLLGGCYALLLTWAARSRLGQCVFIVSLALPSKTFFGLAGRFLPEDYTRFTWGSETVLELGLLALLLLLAMKWAEPMSRWVRSAGLLMVPFIAVILIQVVWAVRHYDEREFANQNTAPVLPAKLPRRVAWIIFDELDQELAFDQRPAGLALPEFDRFKETALYATAAYPPATATLMSLPALLTGRRLTEIRLAGPGDLKIEYADSPGEVTWSEQSNVFLQAREFGVNSALVGWYHPYCREIQQALTSCWWSAFPFQGGSVRRNFVEAVPDYLRGLFETDHSSPFGQTLADRASVERRLASFEEARRVVSDKSFGLVFLHLQVPHAPHVYDRRTAEFSRAGSDEAGYTDSLALADKVLGQLRHSLEASSLWDSTDILVSSDHWYRRMESATPPKQELDHRVPFLLKLARQKKGSIFASKFGSAVSAELVLDLLQDKLTTEDQAVDWLSRHVSDADTYLK